MNETPKPQATHPYDHRCYKCGRLLGRFLLTPGARFDIRCGKCSHQNRYFQPFNSTSVAVFISVIDHVNGSTPPELVTALHGLMERNGFT